MTGRLLRMPLRPGSEPLERAVFGRSGMDFYELRHFCATHLLELGVSHAAVAIPLGHTDGGALVMATYGHPSENAARERLKRAYRAPVRRLRGRDEPHADDPEAV